MSRARVHLQADKRSITERARLNLKNAFLSFLTMSSTKGLPKASLKSSIAVPDFLEVRKAAAGMRMLAHQRCWSHVLAKQ